MVLSQNAAASCAVLPPKPNWKSKAQNRLHDRFCARPMPNRKAYGQANMIASADRIDRFVEIVIARGAFQNISAWMMFDRMTV